MIFLLIKRLFHQSVLTRRLGVLFLAMFLLNVLFGTAFYVAERGVNEELTYLDSLWWAMVTMTTVGYGDYFAKTWVGRFLVSYPTFIIGIGLIGYFLGSVAQVIIETTAKRRQGRAQLTMKDHILICGYPSSAKVLQIAQEIRAVPQFEKTPMVLICEAFETLPEELREAGIHFVRGSAFSEEALQRANITSCHGAFILSEDPTTPNSDARVFAIGTLIESIEQESGHPIRTVCELAAIHNRTIMRRSGADGVVAHQGMTDCLLVQEYLNPGIMLMFRQMVSNAVGSQFYLVPSMLAGRKLIDVQIAALQHTRNIQIIGIVRAGEALLNPSKDLLLQGEDRLVILADRIDDFKAVEADILQLRA